MVPINTRANRAMRLATDPLDTSADVSGFQTQGTEFTGIHEYFAMARRRWKLVLIVALLATAYTFNSVRKERPQYRSRTTVRLVDASRAIAGGMADNGVSTTAEMPFSRGTDPIQSQIQILQSEAVVSTAVDLKGLRLAPIANQPVPGTLVSATVEANTAASVIGVKFGPTDFVVTSNGKTASAPYGQAATIDGVTLAFSSNPGFPATSFRIASKEEVMSAILSQFKVSARPQTDILDLSFTDLDAWQATRIANAMAEAYQYYNKTNAQQFSRRRLTFLEGQLRQTDSILNATNAALADFRAGRQSSAVATAVQTSNATQLAMQRSALETERRTLDALLSRPHQTPEAAAAAVRAVVASPAVAANPVIQQFSNQLASQQSIRDNLVSGGASSTNPDLVAVNAQIAATTSRLFDAVETQRQSVDTRIEALSHVSNGTVPVVGTSDGETREAQLSSEVQSNQKLASDLKAELQKAKMSEAIESGQVEIVQLSRTPGYRIASGAERKVFLGLVVGLMFGFAAAVFADSLDKSIRRRGDIEPLLGVPGLVVIPRLPGLASPGLKSLPSLGRRSEKAIVASASAEKPDLVTLTHPQSPSAEAFRTLRTNLMFSHAVTEMRRLVVTSASPAEGKTLTSANLAVAFAQQGIRVLLVDCDLRRGRLHKLFDLPREPGISEFVLGFSSEEEVTHETTVPGLYLISTGKLPPNPAELLGGAHMRTKLDKLAEGFDLMIFDSPPLLAASDAAILATISDGAIMVLRAGSTESAAAQQAMQQLNSVRVRVVGAVLNDPEGEVKKYGSYYKYDYSAAGV